MKLKRTFASIASALMLMTAVALPASAAVKNAVLYASINGGATVSSVSAKKESAGNFTFVAQPNSSDGWSSQGDEWVYFRGRSSDGAQATSLAHKSYSGTKVDGQLGYYSGYGLIGTYYKMAIEYDSNNPYEYVNLYVSWIP